MAKIDTSTIAGYSDMTAEEKLAALEGLELPEPDYTGYVKKATFDATASELSKLKKQNTERMSEDERKEAETAEKLASMEKELNTLRKEKTISGFKAKYIAQGYTEDLAEATAKALAEGDTEKVFANQSKFLKDYEKKIKADSLKDTPKPPAGAGSEGMTLKKLKSLSDAEYNKFAIEHPEEFKALYERGE